MLFATREYTFTQVCQYSLRFGSSFLLLSAWASSQMAVGVTRLAAFEHTFRAHPTLPVRR